MKAKEFLENCGMIQNDILGCHKTEYDAIIFCEKMEQYASERVEQAVQADFLYKLRDLAKSVESQQLHHWRDTVNAIGHIIHIYETYFINQPEGDKKEKRKCNCGKCDWCDGYNAAVFSMAQGVCKPLKTH